MVNIFFNKIYYAFSKTEDWIDLTKKRGDFSGGWMLEIIAGFEFGIACLLASIPTYLFVRNYFNYIITIPLLAFIVILFIVQRFTKKYIWYIPNKSLWKQFDEDVIIPLWVAIGIVTNLCSLICAIGGGILFYLSLFHIYDN